MRHLFPRGLAVALPGEPEQKIRHVPDVASVALLGADYPGLRFDMLVAEGDSVAAGDPLFRDRKRPAIRFTAPVAGRVAAITLGPRRSLAALRLTPDGDAVRAFEVSGTPDPGALRAVMQEAGLWPALRRRPYGGIPDPDEKPGAILVAAIDTQPFAADPRVALADRAEDFETGVTALERLTEGPVFVCHGPGPAPLAARGRIRTELFAGPEPAGQPGTHIDRLFPVRDGRRTAWQVHCQDVAALGALLRTGRRDARRVVALAGAGIADPRLIRVPEGACLEDMVAGGLTGGPLRLLSGAPVAGRESAYLRRHHWQVTALPRTGGPASRGAAWLPAAARPLRPAPFVPTRALESSLGPDLPLVPLLRALDVGDIEAAARLGVRALLEEDMALPDWAAGGGQGFAAMLRRTLDRLQEEDA